MIYPPPKGNRPVDHDALGFASDFVKKSMPTLNPKLDGKLESTCIAGFAELTTNDHDPGSGFVLDFVPETNKRIILTTGGWTMKFVPMFGKILADLAIDGETSYSEENRTDEDLARNPQTEIQNCNQGQAHQLAASCQIQQNLVLTSIVSV